MLILSTTAYGALVFKVERERLFQIQIDSKSCDPRTRGSETTHKIISNKMLLTITCTVDPSLPVVGRA
jgi:hypothetical protein